MIENITPLGARVLLEVLPAETVRKSGIIIPENEKEIICRGRVISVGPKAGAEIQSGQTVAFPNSPMTRIQTPGPESKNPRLLVEASDIIYIES